MASGLLDSDTPYGQVALGTLRGVVHELASPVAALEMNTRALAKQLTRIEGSAQDGATLELTHELQRDIARSLEGIRAFLDRMGERLAGYAAVGAVHCDALQTVHAVVRGLAEPQPQVIGSGNYAVAIDAEALTVVLRCLIDNARAAAPSADQVQIHVGRGTGGQVRLRVRDAGSGLPEAIAATARRPLVSTHPAALGLGLTIADELVRGMGGKLTLEGAANGGTCATVHLPSGQSG